MKTTRSEVRNIFSGLIRTPYHTWGNNQETWKQVNRNYPNWNSQKENSTQGLWIIIYSSFSVMPDCLWAHGLYPTRLLYSWNYLARILEGVIIPFSRGSLQSRDWTWVLCITGRFFTVWATREVQSSHMQQLHSKVLCCFLIYLYQVCKLIQSLGIQFGNAFKFLNVHTAWLASPLPILRGIVHRDTHIWAQKYLYKDIHWNSACLSIRKWLKKKWLK